MAAMVVTRLTVAFGLVVLAAGPAFANELPEDRRVELEFDASGKLPRTLEGFVPHTPFIVPVDVNSDGTEDHGYLAATSGPLVALLVFSGGTATEWGPVIFYIVVTQNGDVLEWAGDTEWSRRRLGREVTL